MKIDPIVKDLWLFVRRHKMLVMWPILVFVVALTALIVMLQRAPVAPFVYR